MSQILEFPTQTLELWHVECSCGSTEGFDLLEDLEGGEFYAQCKGCKGIMGVGIFLAEED